MRFRPAFLVSMRLLQALAVASTGLAVAYAQAVPGQHSATAAAEKAMAGALPSRMEDELWDAIKESDQAKVFEEYLTQFPGGNKVAQAASRLADLRKPDRPSAARAAGTTPGSAGSNDPETALWKVVFQNNNSGGYEVFLRYFPKGKYARLAASRLKMAQEDARWKAESVEQGAWQAAESAQTADAYSTYLATYPGGRYGALAQAKIEKLRPIEAVTEESRLWQAAEKGGMSQLDAYLASNPNGPHAAAAISRRDRLRKEEADMSPGKVVKDCPGCPEMVVIPAGSFQLGENDAKPVHTVSIGRPFAIAKTEVTQSQWRAVMGTDPAMLARCDNCPVEGVNWYEAKDYVEKLSRMTGKIYRLPSEAEWEYACRAGGRHEYCGSDAIDSVAWHGAIIGSGNSDGKTQPVGLKQANAFGLHDMSGNVSEWVEDCNHTRYSEGPVDGSAWTIGEDGSAIINEKAGSAKGKGKGAGAKATGKDPGAATGVTTAVTTIKAKPTNTKAKGKGVGTKIPGDQDSTQEKDECKTRVLRGGSWLSWPQHTGAAYRFSLPPDNRGSSYGFRPVWSLHQATGN